MTDTVPMNKNASDGLYDISEGIMPALIVLAVPLKNETHPDDKPVSEGVHFLEKEMEKLLTCTLSHNLASHEGRPGLNGAASFIIRKLLPLFGSDITFHLSRSTSGIKEVVFMGGDNTALMSCFIYNQCLELGSGTVFPGTHTTFPGTEELRLHVCFHAGSPYLRPVARQMQRHFSGIHVMNVEWLQGDVEERISSRKFYSSYSDDDCFRDMGQALFEGSLNEVERYAFEIQARDIISHDTVNLHQGLIDAFQRIIEARDMPLSEKPIIWG